MGSAYERVNGKKKKAAEDGECGALSLTVLAHCAQAQWGIVMQVVKMLWRLVMLCKFDGEKGSSMHQRKWEIGVLVPKASQELDTE